MKPSLGVTKANWDMAVDDKRKRIGIGVILRDHEGGVLSMMCETMEHIQDIVTTEVLAARRVVELSQALGIHKLILEGDALQIF
jgi:hypothetical protein